MLELLIELSDIDYREIADKAVPIVIEKLKGSGDPNRLVQILQKSKDLPKIAINTALSLLPQKAKDEIAIKLVEYYGDRLVASFNSFLKKKQLDITFNGLNVSKKENMEVVFMIDSIDYGSVIAKSYPIVIEKIKANEKFKAIASILPKKGFNTIEMLQATLGALPQGSKDDLVICILENYESEILSLINSWADSHQLKVVISGMKVRKA